MYVFVCLFVWRLVCVLYVQIQYVYRNAWYMCMEGSFVDVAY